MMDPGVPLVNLAVSAEGDLLVAARTRGGLRIFFHPMTGQPSEPVGVFRVAPSRFTRVAFSADGRSGGAKK